MARDHSNDAFPTKQLIIIGICRFSEPIAFNSILAYSYLMVKDLGISADEASFYSGLLVSAYAIAEAFTAVAWGAISDVYGRKPVALLGLGGVALSSLLFGCAQSYWVALVARLIGGALNGNVAIMQTMVAEVVTNPEHEPRAYATQPFVWTLGAIIGSAMGGYLAKPAVFYPDTFSPDGLFGRYPYLLPNLVAAISVLLALLQGILFMEETNPALKDPKKPLLDPERPSIDERTPLRHTARDRVRNSMSRSSFRDRSNSVLAAMREVRKRPSFLEESLPMPIDGRFDIRRTSFGTMHSINLPRPELTHRRLPQRPPQKTFNYTVIMLTLSLTIMAYHQMAFVSMMPVWILDTPVTDFGHLDFYGGLGYSLHDVGNFLAVNGFIALFIQGFIFPLFVERVGVWKSFVWMVILYPTSYIIVPFITTLPEKWVSPGVYFAFILQAFFGIVVFPCALILLKNATPSPLVLGRVNGMSMSACCLARTLSSPLVGLIYSLGGSGVAWFSLAGVAVLGALQLCWVPREHTHVEKLEVRTSVFDVGSVFGGSVFGDDASSVAVDD